MSKNILSKSITPFIISLFVVFLTGFIGSLFTMPNISSWYVFLNKPFFSPPNWLFGPAWSFLYLLMGISAFLIWQKRDNPKTKPALGFYAIQLVLNALWSIIFFGMKNPGLAFLEILFLLGFIIITAIKFYQIDKKASLLFIPYILWVSFAAVLNYYLWILN